MEFALQSSAFDGGGALVTRVAIACLALGVLWLFCKSGVPSASAVETLPHETLDHIWATKSDPENGKILYLLRCRSCHGGHAWGDGLRAIPALAGQREKYLVVQLIEFASEKRAGQSMHETMQRSDLDWAQGVRDLGAY